MAAHTKAVPSAHKIATNGGEKNPGRSAFGAVPVDSSPHSALPAGSSLADAKHANMGDHCANHE